MKKISVLITIVVLFVSACSTGKAENKNYTDGSVLLDNYQYSQALEKFKLSLNEDSSLTDSYVKIAQIYSVKSEFEQAIEILKKGEQYAADRAIINLKLAETFRTSGDFDQADSYYEKVFTSDSNNKDAIKGKLKTLAMKSDLEKLTAFANGINQNNLDSELRIFLSYIKSKDSQAAIEYLNGISAEDNTYSKIKDKLIAIHNEILTKDEDLYNYALLAYEAVSSGSPEMAYPVLEKLKEINQYYEGINVYRAVAEQKYFKYDLAESNLKKALEYNPNELSAILLLAENYYRTGKAEESTKILKQNIDKLAKSELKTNEAINMLISKSEYQTAYDLAVKFETQNNKVSKSYLAVKFKLFVEMQKLDKAEKLEKDVNVYLESYDNQTKAEIYAYSAKLKFSLNKKAEALDLIRQSLSFSRILPVAYLIQAEILIDQQQLDKAKESLNSAIDFDLNGNIAKKALNILAKL